jgi:hypothetical protein
MAENDRKALEAMLSKITPLPWEHITDKDKRGQPQFMYRGLVAMVSADSGGDGYNAIVAEIGHVPVDEWRDNAAYLAAAANAVPSLIADLRAAEARAEAAEATLAELSGKEKSDVR